MFEKPKLTNKKAKLNLRSGGIEICLWKQILTYGHNSHNRVSNTLAKKREPNKYNTMKACEGYGSIFHTLIVQDIVIYIYTNYVIYTTTHLSLIYDYSYIRLGEPWGCLTSANVRLDRAGMTEPFHLPID